MKYDSREIVSFVPFEFAMSNLVGWEKKWRSLRRRDCSYSRLRTRNELLIEYVYELVESAGSVPAHSDRVVVYSTQLRISRIISTSEISYER